MGSKRTGLRILREDGFGLEYIIELCLLLLFKEDVGNDVVSDFR